MSKINTPDMILGDIIEDGVSKSSFKTMEQLILGMLGGLFIGLGTHGAITIMQNMNADNAGMMKFAGASIFSVGLMLIILSGGQLFTGNTLLFFSYIEKKITIKNMFKNWTLIYIGNFLGSIILVLIIYYSGLYGTHSHLKLTGELAIKFAHKKVELSFLEAILRGVLCNILVVAAVWMMKGAKTFSGKMLACWFPITCFVLSGYEHCVANMYYLPLGKMLDSSIAWSSIVGNLIPVTIGNIIGGVCFVGCGYYFSYKRKYKEHTRNIL